LHKHKFRLNINAIYEYCLKFDLQPWGFNLNGDKIVVFDEENNVYFYEFK